MLLAYVALKQGDAVGAMTFGTPAGEQRSFAPRKGAHALNALMGELYGVQPTPTHSDYVGRRAAICCGAIASARSSIVDHQFPRRGQRASSGTRSRLLRSRHLVLLASLRERVVRRADRAAARVERDAALDVASAHLYEQARRDALHRLAARDALMVDAEPRAARHRARQPLSATEARRTHLA